MCSIFGSVYIFAAVVAIQSLLIRNVSSLNLTNVYLNHNCNNTQGKYTPGSVFEKNLNQVIKNISTFDLRSGYALDSNLKHSYKNTTPDTVFVLLQCRGDSYGSKCHSCLATALSGLRKRCPGNKGAIIWYDQCLLEISTYNSDDSRIHYENIVCIPNPKNVSGNQKMFNEKRQKLFEKLILEVGKLGKDDKGPLYATGETIFGTKKIYAMVQCTKDLWENGCYVCLEYITQKYEYDIIEGIQGARILGRSCNLRFEIYPFLRT